MILPAIVACIATSYLIGSVPWGYLLVRWTRKIDIREYGSGNIGFTNVLRVSGKPVAFLVLLLDGGKGWVAVAVIASGLQEWVPALDPAFLQIGAFCGVVAGHIFTPFLRFKGGKGIAAAGGAVLALYPLSFAVCFGLWLLLTALTRYISVASVGAAVALPLVMLAAARSLPIVLFTSLLAVLIIFRHLGNLKRLFRGEEHKIGRKVEVTE